MLFALPVGFQVIALYTKVWYHIRYQLKKMLHNAPRKSTRSPSDGMKYNSSTNGDSMVVKLLRGVLCHIWLTQETLACK